MREQYNAQPAVKAIKEDNSVYLYKIGCIIDTVYSIPLEDYINKKVINSIVPFAFIDLDGKWHERGDMGWWGMVSNEVAVEDWHKEFIEYVNSVSEDTLVTVIDCHI